MFGFTVELAKLAAAQALGQSASNAKGSTTIQQPSLGSTSSAPAPKSQGRPMAPQVRPGADSGVAAATIIRPLAVRTRAAKG